MVTKKSVDRRFEVQQDKIYQLRMRILEILGDQVLTTREILEKVNEPSSLNYRKMYVILDNAANLNILTRATKNTPMRWKRGPVAERIKHGINRIKR